MKVSEIARSADVNPDTVRFYTREGLLQPYRDPENGYQLSGNEDLRRFSSPARPASWGSV